MYSISCTLVNRPIRPKSENWARICTAPRVARNYYINMTPAGLRTKNDCAGEDHQQFAGLTDEVKTYYSPIT
jgi:hypothetical protein